MILGKNTLRIGLTAAAVAAILTLTNFFVQLQGNQIITNVLNLSQLALYVILVTVGFIAGRQVMNRGLLSAAVNGGVAALVVGLGLSAIVILTGSVNVTFVFRNMQPLSRSSLTDIDNLISISILAVIVIGDFLIVADWNRTRIRSALLRLLAVIVIVLALDVSRTLIESPAVALVIVSIMLGAAGGAATQIPARVRSVIVGTVAVVAIIGVLQGQINRIITLSDAAALALAFAGGYFAAKLSGIHRIPERVVYGAVVGIGVALVLGGLAVFTGLERGTILRGGGSVAPTILALPLGDVTHTVVFGLGLALAGAAGAAVTTANQVLHNGGWYVISLILQLGVLASQRSMSLPTAIVIASIMALTLWLLPNEGKAAESRFAMLGRGGQNTSRRTAYLAGFVLLLVLPGFIGLSLSNTLNLMMIYIVMGVGMNVMIGFAGLLDLGYVASFAIGAYTIGLLTTPSMVTCGGVSPDQLRASGLAVAEACTGLMTFWQAWPIAILVSALTGMALGVPVLRLRGDYLAIVTLGFGEIINRLVNSSTFKPLLGGSQGIGGIPVPTLDLSFINPNWSTPLARSTEIYYLFLFTVIIGTLVVLRLVNSRLGRAWRALRDDEDVAEATGIHLVGAKLLAFGISSAFSGMGGALFGASLQGIFPNSFTLQVSIFVLSLVIVGGMGSIPAVFVGALVLIGLPELLRELQDYRLLAFGVLLVVVMLSKPEGLLPPQPPKLSEKSTVGRQAEAAAAAD